MQVNYHDWKTSSLKTGSRRAFWFDGIILNELQINCVCGVWDRQFGADSDNKPFSNSNNGMKTVTRGALESIQCSGVSKLLIFEQWKVFYWYDSSIILNHLKYIQSSDLAPYCIVPKSEDGNAD